jgi:hypothetical protein
MTRGQECVKELCMIIDDITGKRNIMISLYSEFPE